MKKIMYCPQCATPLSDDQKFCRACGLGLEKVSRVLAGEHLADEPDKSEYMSDERFQSRKVILERWGIITIIVALLVGCLIPIILGINMYYPGLIPLVLILSGLAGFLLFSGAILLIYADGLPKKPADRDSSRSAKLPQAKQTNKLPPEDHSEYIPSVTEGTTDLLESAKAKEKRTSSG
jgi:hypothetical protein